MTKRSVIPVQTGIQLCGADQWIPASAGMTKERRYEYDGLNLLRVDERYDTGGGAIDANDPWRTLEVSTHSPGLVGDLVGKRAYRHTDNDATPNATYDYVYVYDAVGNLYLVLNDDGGEEYAFSQDAWGNELSIGSFYGTAWSSLRTYGVSEHQTGKWIDPFTGLYFFHHRWYESGLGRWVSQDPLGQTGPLSLSPLVSSPSVAMNYYEYCVGDPVNFFDPVGLFPWIPVLGCIGGALGVALKGGGLGGPACGCATGAIGGIIGTLLPGTGRTQCLLGLMTGAAGGLCTAATEGCLDWKNVALGAALGCLTGGIGAIDDKLENGLAEFDIGLGLSLCDCDR